MILSRSGWSSWWLGSSALSWLFHSDFCVGGNDTLAAELTSRSDVSLLLRWSERCVTHARMVCPVLRAGMP
jgi:hypothetical protein